MFINYIIPMGFYFVLYRFLLSYHSFGIPWRNEFQKFPSAGRGGFIVGWHTQSDVVDSVSKPYRFMESRPSHQTPFLWTCHPYGIIEVIKRDKESSHWTSSVCLLLNHRHHLLLSCDHLSLSCDHLSLSYDHLALICDYLSLTYDHLALSCDLLSLSRDHLALYCDYLGASNLLPDASNLLPDRRK